MFPFISEAEEMHLAITGKTGSGAHHSTGPVLNGCAKRGGKGLSSGFRETGFES